MKFLRSLIMGLRNLPEGEVGRKVYAERVRITNSLSPVAIGGLIAAAAVTTFALSHAVERTIWAGWTALIIVCIALLVALVVGYRTAKPTPEQAARWALGYELVGMVNGIA